MILSFLFTWGPHFFDDDYDHDDDDDACGDGDGGSSSSCKRIDRWTDERTNERIYGWIDEWAEKRFSPASPSAKTPPSPREPHHLTFKF